MLANERRQIAALMTVDDLADKMKVCRSTIRNMRLEGRVPEPLRLGGHTTRWCPAEIDAWIASGCPSAVEWRTLKANRAEEASR